MHPEDRERAYAAIEAGRETGRFVVEFRLVTDAHGTRAILAIGELERDEDGRPVRLRGSLQDITEQREAERALAAAAAEREAAARERAIADELQRSLLPSGPSTPSASTSPPTTAPASRARRSAATGTT